MSRIQSLVSTSIGNVNDINIKCRYLLDEICIGQYCKKRIVDLLIIFSYLSRSWISRITRSTNPVRPLSRCGNCNNNNNCKYKCKNFLMFARVQYNTNTLA